MINEELDNIRLEYNQLINMRKELIDKLDKIKKLEENEDVKKVKGQDSKAVPEVHPEFPVNAEGEENTEGQGDDVELEEVDLLETVEGSIQIERAGDNIFAMKGNVPVSVLAKADSGDK